MRVNPNAFLNPDMPVTQDLIDMVLYPTLPSFSFSLTETDDYGHVIDQLYSYIPTKLSKKPHKGQPLWDDFSITFMENL